MTPVRALTSLNVRIGRAALQVRACPSDLREAESGFTVACLKADNDTPEDLEDKARQQQCPGANNAIAAWTNQVIDGENTHGNRPIAEDSGTDRAQGPRGSCGHCASHACPERLQHRGDGTPRATPIAKRSTPSAGCHREACRRR